MDRVVFAKRTRRKAHPGRQAAAVPKRTVGRKLDLKALNPLRPLWRWAQAKLIRQPSWHAFVDWQAYYSAYLRTDDASTLIHHSGPYVGGLTQQIDLINGMLAGRGAAIVSAPPGCGKSRFALELARHIEREHPRSHALFVRHDERAAREELPNLTQLKRVILIVDDAHDCPELIELLARSCAESSATASQHLVCLTRSTRRAEVRRSLNTAFAAGNAVLEVDLGRPSADLVRTLIDRLLPQSSPHHRDTIARFARESCFGAVLACTVLSREGKLPQTFQRHDLRDRISRGSLGGAAEGVCAIESALRAFAVYAALAPVPKADVRDWAAKSSGIAPATVDVLMDRAVKAGLFHEDGHGFTRPVPDLVGDLILELASLDTGGNPTPFAAELLGGLLEAEPGAAIRNCANVGQLFGTAGDMDLLSRLVLERAQAIPAGNKWDALELLQMTQPLAASRPATVIELTRILEGRGIMRRHAPAAELFSSNSVEMSTCSLLMSAGLADSTVIPVALGLARDLYAASRQAARSREHLLEQLKAYCRLDTGRSVAHAQGIADTLRGWVGEADIEAAALSASLISQFLTLEVQSPPGEGQAPTSSSPLVPAPEVWSVRDVAIDTLSRAIAHGDATVQCAAIASLERYAERQGAPDRAWWEGWLPQLTRETEQLSAALVKLVKETTQQPVLAAVELQGWRWWARLQDVLHRAGAVILRAVPDTDAYRLWKLLYAPSLPVDVVLPDPAPTGSQDRRLQHVQGFSARRKEDRIAQARQLFDSLTPRYPDAGAWRALWLAVLAQSSGIPLDQSAGAVIGEFARRHPEAAWPFVNQADAQGPLFAALPFILMELGKLDRARRSREARDVPFGTRLEEAWLHALSFTTDLDEPERTILSRGLESPDSDTVHHAAEALLAGGNGRAPAFLRVFRVIVHRPTDSELWELLIERFVNWAEVVLPPRSGQPTDEMTRVADELTRLLQTHGSHVRWGFQRHTRQLPKALAIAAVLCPRRLQEWMRREWGQSEATAGTWSDASPLSTSRLSEIMRPLVDSPAAAHWIDVFTDWMRHEPQLAGVGALGLAELCSLDDPRVRQLAKDIETHPTDASRQALEAFVHQRKRRERPSSG